MLSTARGLLRRRIRRWKPATSSVGGAIRNLNLHEFPSMELLREHGIRTPRAFLASNPEEAKSLFRDNFSKEDGREPGFHEGVVKAQVLSGGQNSSRLVSDPDTVLEVSRELLLGSSCQSVVLVEHLRLKRELYLAILMDRNSQAPLLIGSACGGSSSFLREGRSISDSLAALSRRPDSVVTTEHIDIFDGLETDQCERMAENLGLDPGTQAFDQTVETMANLYSMFVERDCTMIEVHPLGETHSGDIVAVNTRVQFDDNAFFRQQDIFAQRDWDQQDPREARAKKEGIDYIGLDGSIGCMVNGAGLAMATMDLIHSKGGKPSNFLDVGGGANQHQVQTAMAILEADPRVKVILVNIFGGLMRCDVIANGILSVSREIGIQTPMVLRLQGTNYEDAKALIAEECGMYGDIRLVDDLDDATELVVAIANGRVASSASMEAEGATSDSELVNEDGDDDPLELPGLIRDTEDLVAATAAATVTAAQPHEERAIPRFEGFSL